MLIFFHNALLLHSRFSMSKGIVTMDTTDTMHAQNNMINLLDAYRKYHSSSRQHCTRALTTPDILCIPEKKGWNNYCLLLVIISVCYIQCEYNDQYVSMQMLCLAAQHTHAINKCTWIRKYTNPSGRITTKKIGVVITITRIVLITLNKVIKKNLQSAKWIAHNSNQSDALLVVLIYLSELGMVSSIV